MTTRSLAPLIALLCLLVTALSHAQSFPAKPIRLVVPYPAGGATDMMARLVAQKLTDSLKQQVVVDNKPGAGGNIGVEMVAKAPADGYTIGISATNSFAINPHLTKKLLTTPSRKRALVCWRWLLARPCCWAGLF